MMLKELTIKRLWVGLCILAMSVATNPLTAFGQSNADYTAVPPFLGTAVPPNILFVVDLSEAMLPAAYGSYPLSYYTPGIGATYASNYNGTGFTVTDSTDSYMASRTYFGMFDSLGCYTATSSEFAARTAKALVTDLCANTQWDGNFLNWLAMRKADLAKKVLIGGRTVSASNTDGTANSLLGEPKTGQAGSTNTCNSTSKSCYRYVKFVPSSFLAGRVPSSLAADTASFSAGSEAPGTISTSSTSVTGVGTGFTRQFQAGDSFKAGGVTRTVQSVTDDTHLTLTSAFASNLVAGTVYYGPGRYFGSGEGTLYVNDDTTADPFCNGCKYPIQVDLTAESTAYRQAQSLGLLQNMNTTSMRVAVMFTNSSNGVAATLFRPFDGNFNASAITGIRNQPLSSYAALAEGAYEALCYYRNSQGPCFNNNPNDFSASVGAQGDPYFFTSINQYVSCCKSFIVMISSGQPSQDANNNPNPAPFGSLFTIPDTIGLTSTRLDDVALYGQTHDIRDQAPGLTGALSGTQNVTFYTVNAMGGAAGAAVLASGAKFGGFVDQDGNSLPNATGQSCTYPAGSSLGSGTSTSSPEWDVDQDCVPDTYFDASDGSDLEAQINYAIVSILKRAASGTSSSVLASSATGEGATYQAYFFPSITKVVGTSTTSVIWTGYLQGLFVDQYGNLREDYSAPGCTGSPDGKLVLKHDCIVKIRTDTATNTVVVDRYKDADGDGLADTSTPFQTVTLREIQPLWEAGMRLALTDPEYTCPANTGGVTCRRILTWVDINNNGLADATERIEFTANTAADVANLCPFLGNVNISDGLGNDPSASKCSAGGADQTAARGAATNIINFIRGQQVANMRDRQLTVVNDVGVPTTAVWKLGDIVSSTPVVVAAPRERYDVIYGDATYGTFYQRYKDRRQVSYVGANDGMLHAFNAGFYILGDDTSTVGVVEQVRFTTTPKQPGTSTNCASLPCDGSVATYAYRTNNPKLGAELWAFIPQDLLPHLQWLTDPNYAHVYYVDLKPKITDVRIFANDADHPGGWGTILIGGFRLGGSCRGCPTEGKAFMVAADFAGTGAQSRVFLSSYFVLDVTNPEKDPVLLWTFRDMDLGLTTSVPAVLRVSPAIDAKTSSANEKWYVIFGTGPTSYRGVAGKTGSTPSVTAKFFAVDLKLGPAYSAVNQTTGTVNGYSCTAASGSPCIAVSTTGQQVRIFDTHQPYAFMGDVVALDLDLDYRVDAIYAGTVMCNGTVPSADCVAPAAPTWKGAMYRLTTNGGNTDPGTWGVADSSNRKPMPLVSTFAYTSAQATTCSNASPCKIGPITSGPAMTNDTNNNLWILFGTGRFYATLDASSTDIQHFFGVKDSFMTLGSPDQNTERNNLYNVSTVAICTSCTSSTNVSYNGGTSYTGGFETLVGNIQNVDGWFVALPTTSERNLSSSTLLGGSVYFTTFVPSLDICSGSGTGSLYGLYYLTGTPYTTSALGVTTGADSNTVANRSISTGSGLPSNMAVQVGGQGTGGGGATSNAGCSGRATGFIQTSGGVLQQVCMSASSGQIWSRFLSWRDL
jgi:type IV pilus assembly protein PilY1